MMLLSMNIMAQIDLNDPNWISLVSARLMSPTNT